MNKTQIIELVAEKIDTQSIKSITEVLNNFIEVVAELLADNQAVNIQGFLSIQNKIQKAKSGNFNGVKWETKDRLMPKVKLSSKFKEAVQNES